MENNLSSENLKQSTFKRFWGAKEVPVLLITIGFFIIMSIASPHFLTEKNILTTLVGLSAEGIVVIGMTLILAMGGIDLSVGSVMGLASMIAATMAAAGVNIWFAALVGIIAGAGCGFANGFMIGKVKLTPFIMTLAMMSIAKGITMLATSGSALSIPSADESFLFLGQGTIGNIPFIIIIFAALAILFYFLMKKTELFRNVFYVGSNEKAARLSGVNVMKMKFVMYTLVGLLSALAGIVSLSRFGACTPTTGEGVEMNAISAAVIGGASLSGGEGSILGAVLGIILLNVVNNGLILLNVSVYGQDLVSGAILLIAVTIDTFSHARKAR